MKIRLVALALKKVCVSRSLSVELRLPVYLKDS